MAPVKILPAEQANAESFHDCHVRGISWSPGGFSFEILLDYLAEWIPPTRAGDGYSFMISPALLRFKDADDVVVSMDWRGSGLSTQIAQMSVVETRATPTGVPQYRYLIEFSEPEGQIEIWSTGHEVRLLRAPVLSPVPFLGDDESAAD